MRVLIVEDDRALGLFLQKGLTQDGHEVGWAGDGAEALELSAQRQPDLMVLDFCLPEQNGTEVLEAMRDRHVRTSVLVLTRHLHAEERVRCLDLGADDCMFKPFSFHELAARCRAILRRQELFADPVLRCGGLEMNRMERRVMYAGRAVELTVREFALLEFLLQREGECCTRAELLSRVWQASPEAGPNVVDVYVTYLRRKLGAVAGQGLGDSMIETVRGSGYRMRAERLLPAVILQPALQRAQGMFIPPLRLPPI
jgi:DNA-binding response OmpR family regulator